MTDGDKITAPFTDDQQASLFNYQVVKPFHPFTCGNDSSHKVLIAQNDGWHCPDCDYRQDWAWSWMADWSWRRMAKR